MREMIEQSVEAGLKIQDDGSLPDLPTKELEATPEPEAAKEPDSEPTGVREALEEEKPVDTPEETPDASETTTEDEKPTEPEEEEINLGFSDTEEDDTDARGDEFDEAAFDAETEKETSGMESEKEINKWKQLRSELKDYKKGEKKTQGEIDKEAEMESLRDKAQRVEEVESLLEEFQKSDWELKVKKSKEYKEAFDKPLDDIETGIVKLSEDFEIPAQAIVDAVMEPSMKKRIAMVDALMEDETDEGISNAALKAGLQSQVSNMADVRTRAVQSQKRLLDSAKETHEKAQLKAAEEAKESKGQRMKLHRAQVDNVAKDFGKLNLDDSRSDALQDALKQAKAMDVEGMSTQNVAYAIASGAALPTVIKELKALRKENAELKSGKAKKDQSKTNLSDGAPNEVKDSPKGPMTLAEAARQAFGSA
jgi:hypothetical protein